MRENTVTKEHIESILKKSEFICDTHFDKCTVLTCRLPNGFTITESSACVDPKNYDKTIGREACMSKIRNKLWELEGYLLQNKMYEEVKNEPKTMTFTEAIKLAKPGTKVKRKPWDVLFVEITTEPNGGVCVRNTGFPSCCYALTPIDLSANDWIIIEP